MCSIAGVFSRKNEDVFPFLCDMLSMARHRGSDGFGICVEGKTVRAQTFNALLEKKVSGNFGIGHSLLSVTGHGMQPFSSCDKKTFLCHNGQIYNYLELNKGLSSHRFESSSDSETILHFLEEHDFNYKKLMQSARGSYAVGLCFGNRLLAFRDFVGVRPLWFGQNDRFFAFASEPIALRKIGLEFPQPLLPGHLLEITKKGLSVKKVFSFSDFEKTVPKKHSAKALSDSFNEAIFLRCRGISKAAVLFSGGIDSSAVAKAVSMHVKDTGLFCAGLKGSHDLVQAEKTAAELGLKFFPCVIEKEELPLLALKCLRSMSFFDQMQLGIAIPLFVACVEAKKHGYRVIFSGQGSDEIFAGYSFYKNILIKHGHAGVQKEIFSQLECMWSKNLFRDDIISMQHSIELRLPFLDSEFLRQALAFPANEKIFSQADDLRKHPVREIGKKLGLPQSVVNRPKKAMQYGSGIAKEIHRFF